MLLVQTSAPAQRKALQTLVKTQWLDKMECHQQELCPVDVLLILYDIVSTYMTTKKRDEGNYLGRGSYDNIRSWLTSSIFRGGGGGGFSNLKITTKYIM